MATFQKFNSFVEAVAEKKHDLGGDVLKFYLTNATPVATNTQKSHIAEIAAGNGYTAGGNQANITTSAQTAGTYKLVLANPTAWTASVGPIATFRYAVLYNDSAANDELIGFFDYGSAVTVQVGETFAVECNGSTGLLTIA
jgi:hypothetical protein